MGLLTRILNTLEQLIQAAVAAPPARQEAALQVLRGLAVAVEPGSQAPVHEPLLTMRELSRRIGFSVSSLNRWQVPGHDLGASPRYRLTEVETYLASPKFQRRQAALRAERSASTTPLARAVTGRAPATLVSSGRELSRT